jgi:hypothetical protein
MVDHAAHCISISEDFGQIPALAEIFSCIISIRQEDKWRKDLQPIAVSGMLRSCMLRRPSQRRTASRFEAADARIARNPRLMLLFLLRRLTGSGLLR